MTTYAHDPVASTIVACWPTGDGAVAHRAARVPKSLDHSLARRTAKALSALSTHLWATYADQAAHELDPETLAAAVRHPNQPVGDLLRVMEDGCAETAHLLGRIVARAPGRAFRDAVVADVRAETDAVLDADDGVLTGRSAQAVVHPRCDAPAEQLLVAHSLLHDDPLGPPAIVTSVEPNAAAVATLRWLRASAALVAERVGHTVPDVVALAEAIGHEDLAVTRHVLCTLAGTGEAEVVLDLLQEAVLARRGWFVVCPEPAPDPERGHRAVSTVLDPLDPASCLLDGLVRGLHGCFRVWLDDVVARETPGADPRLVGTARAAALRLRYTDEVRRSVRAGR
ncbi:hypothetical protein ND486_16865 [Pseudonocardia sp. DR1-2]|uniref:hypothetical protein n=1 Tax=Pseudonocardia sp. DR1-2 TaxID=2951168 RepID=UPI00204458B3|nr:hypothetical protein [Pseudonocardia sp. DR1-2]MCM3847862.1 hypothetical protein [Pseudonocardia sp. DR1-2]